MGIIINESELNQREIKVQTRTGRDISNNQSFMISYLDRSQFPDIQRKFSDGVTFRSRPTAIYNCHGLTFASRRTRIYEAEEAQKILKDDNYKEVRLEEVLPGDIVLYFASDGDIEHSGVIVSKPDPELGVPKVYSKWGNYSEAIHYAPNCPYTKSIVKYYRVDK